MDILFFALEITRVLLGFCLVLFIPGFALTGVLYPQKNEIPFTTRLALSFALSIASVMLVILFSDIYLGIDTTTINIIIILVTFTILLTLIWFIEKHFFKSGLKNTIWDRSQRLYRENPLFKNSSLFKIESNYFRGIKQKISHFVVKILKISTEKADK